MSTTAIESTIDQFEYIPGYRIVVCKEHRYGLRDLKRHLLEYHSLTHEARVDVGHKADQEPLLAGVTDRNASRIDTQDEIEPDCRTPRTDVLNRHVIDPATLEADELLMRGARRGGNGAQA